MMNLKKLIGIFSLLVLFSSCEDKNDLADEGIKDPIFYYVGYSFTNDYWEKNRKAILVVNDSITKLSPNNRSDAKVVFSNGKHIYVGGYQHNGTENTRVVYWANGKINYLSEAGVNNTATAINEDAGNVYVAGTVREQSGPYQRLWRNGERVVNSGAIDFSGIRVITVKDGKFYASGQFGQAGALWDEKSMRTTALAPSEGTGIQVDGENIYTIGYGNVNKDTDAAKVWNINKEVFSHPVNERVYEILGTIVGSDYYYVTHGVSGKPRVFKNKELLYEIGNGQDMRPEAIQVHNKKVYVLGNIFKNNKSIPTLWADGVPQALFKENENIYLNHFFIR